MILINHVAEKEVRNAGPSCLQIDADLIVWSPLQATQTHIAIRIEQHELRVAFAGPVETDRKVNSQRHWECKALLLLFYQLVFECLLEFLQFRPYHEETICLATVFIKIVLVIMFSLVKTRKRNNLRHDRPNKCMG